MQQKPGAMVGSSLTLLAGSAMCKDNSDCLWLFGGLNLEINKLVDCLYKFDNVFCKEQKVECTLYPGPLRLGQLNERHRQELLQSQHIIQTGQVPEARADHHLLYISNTSSILLLGGRALSKRNQYTPVEEYKNCSNNAYNLSLQNLEWHKIETDPETQFHLQRSQFGCCLIFPLVFITGGIRRGQDGHFEALDIDQLVIYNIITRTARVKKLQGLVTQHKLLSVNLSKRPNSNGAKTELLLFGGSTLERDHLTSDNLKKSTNYFFIMPDEDKIQQFDLQGSYAAKAAISGRVL